MMTEVGAQELIDEKFYTPLICLSEGPARIEGAGLSVEIRMSVAAANNRQTITG
jgi:hypothetical protein